MKAFWGKTLAFSMVRSNVLIIIISLLTVTVFIYKLTEAHITSEAAAKNQIIARAVTNNMSQILSEPLNDLRLLSSVQSSGLALSLDGLMERLVAEHDIFHSIEVIDYDGLVTGVAPGRYATLGLNRAGQDSFISAKRDKKVVWSSPFISLDTKAPTVTLAVPGPKGIIMGYLRLERISQMSAEFSSLYGNHIDLVITDKYGVYISNKDHHLVNQRSVDRNFETVISEVDNDKDFVWVIRNGKQYMAITKKLELTGWHVIVYQPGEAIYEPVNHITRALLTLLLALILILTGVSYLQAARLLRSLNNFSRQAENIADGFYGSRVDRQPFEELESLAQNFNTMARSIQQRDDRLKETLKSLHSAVQEMDQFAYIVSHDLKAPLRAIDHLSEWISEDKDNVISEESQNYLQLIAGRVRRMWNLIDGILQYSRVGRVEGEVSAVIVSELLGEIVKMLDMPENFVITIDSGMPVLHTEKLRLEQVFTNLINNAINHHHLGKGRILVGYRDLGDYCEFSVSDDGPGIAPEYQHKIFTIFQTLKPGGTNDGTGIGLALVKKIVEDKGGTIALESKAGQGATFRFTWPKDESSKESDIQGEE